MANVKIRKIEHKDNPAIAQVIRKSLEEYGQAKPGTVYTDPTTDDLYTLFQTEKSIYFILLVDDEVAGGCGIFPTPGLPKGCGELVKLYLASSFRGNGLGKQLMQKCIHTALEMEYTQLYLESIPALNNAVHLYRKMGFQQIDHRLGDSGHFSCNLWMMKSLVPKRGSK